VAATMINTHTVAKLIVQSESLLSTLTSNTSPLRRDELLLCINLVVRVAILFFSHFLARLRAALLNVPMTLRKKSISLTRMQKARIKVETKACIHT
jgi:hypothetical protein